MAKKVAVVTGSNKGIGYAIVRALLKSPDFDGDVFLTSRDEARGQEAVKQMEAEGLKPKFHQLDINDHESLVKLRDFLKENYGGLDILVNNAGIAYKAADTTPFSEQATVTNKTNFYATLDACNVLFPLLRSGARVSNVSSMASQFSLSKCSDAMRAVFVDPNLTMKDLEGHITKFVEAAQTGKHQELGYSNSSYGMSKVGVTVMSMIQQRELDAKGADDIVVNACCPGYVDTDMSSHKGTLTIDQGAETPTYLALLPPKTDIRGKFLRKKEVSEWTADVKPSFT